jgi:hypothetical protein
MEGKLKPSAITRAHRHGIAHVPENGASSRDLALKITCAWGSRAGARQILGGLERVYQSSHA